MYDFMNFHHDSNLNHFGGHPKCMGTKAYRLNQGENKKFTSGRWLVKVYDR